MTVSPLRAAALFFVLAANRAWVREIRVLSLAADDGAPFCEVEMGPRRPIFERRQTSDTVSHGILLFWPPLSLGADSLDHIS